MWIAGERHSRQAVEAPRREEPQAIPPGPPRISDARMGIKDHEVAVLSGEEVADRQSCLSPPMTTTSNRRV